jgi:hypothetical protein
MDLQDLNLPMHFKMFFPLKIQEKDNKLFCNLCSDDTTKYHSKIQSIYLSLQKQQPDMLQNYQN